MNLKRFHLLPLLLVLLALADLRQEGVLLMQHFTWSSLSFGLANHLLAVVVLLASPSLFRHYR